MNETPYFLILLGGLFLLSMLVSHLAHKLNIPRVTLLIGAGIAIGPSGLNMVNGLEQTWFPTISSITLLVIGYLLGAKMTKSYIYQYGIRVSLVAVLMTFTTFFTIFIGLYLINFNYELAAILAALAVATDASATLDVVNENRSRNNKEFKDLIRGVVALDDFLGLLLFSIVITILASYSSASHAEYSGFMAFYHFLYETFGALLLGVLMGAACRIY